MAFRLKIIAGPDKGHVLELADVDTQLLGRGRASHARLCDPHISRVHCQLRTDGHRLVVTDAMSSSGTFVNGRRIARHELVGGEVLQIGKTALRLIVGAADEGAQSQRTKENSVSPRADQLDSRPPWLIQIPDPDPGAAAELLGHVGAKVADFELGEPLDQGKTGILFFGRKMPSGRIVAVKVLWPGFAHQPQQLQRFRRAMRTSQVLLHPNLVRIYGAGKSGGCCWIAMEYIEGRSAARFIRHAGVAGRLGWRLGLRLAHHIATALKFAHAHSILHRNVTPNNVLLRTKDHVAKLGDLMLAKALAGDHVDAITAPGDILGELPYLSPEQTRGTRDLDARSDLYSLGATVYALLAGRPPFIGSTVGEVTDRIRREPVRGLREAQADPVGGKDPSGFQSRLVALQLEEIPTSFEGIVLRMLAKRPDDRHQSAAQLVGDLEKLAAATGVAV